MKIIEKKTRGLALLVTTAATLGTIQVPLYAQAQDVVSAAEAAINTSDGIRAHGAIKKADQKDSTLRPGEYEVSASAEDIRENMPGGWRVTMSNGSGTAAQRFNKPNWDKPFGVQISFNNSQDRTVRHWDISDSGRIPVKADISHAEGDDKPVYEHVKRNDMHGSVLHVHSLNPGVTFFTDEGFKNCSSECPPITHKADEVMYLSYWNDRQTIFTMSSKMSAQDVLDMSKSDWMTYGWAWEYEGEGDAYPPSSRLWGSPTNFIATASFNPWPSENNNFTRITTTWEDIKNLVIEPGKEIKIGHINADADSIPRMLVEGYNEQDTFIGTSSTDFSQGGKKNIRIDNNGDIFWTPDSYIDNDLSNQKSIKFTAYAMPRSVEQLKSAFLEGYREKVNDNLEFTKPDPSFPDENAYVGEESNVLPRYKYANEIDSHTVNFDDEMYHNPGYDNTRKNIISGVSQQGVFTGKEQNVTFNPKDFGNILQSKAQGGNDATIKLDTTDVFPGWKATLNKDNTVTVTAPGDALPGTFAQPRVVVTYTNGSQDIIPLMVSVRPNDTQVTNFTAGEGVSGIPGEEMSIRTSVSPQYNAQPAKTPVSYEIKPGTYPQDTWDVSVDNNGVVKATPHVDVPNGTTISPVVIAHYADKTTDEAKAVFTANMQVNTPQYKSVSGTVNNTVSILPEVPQEEGKISPSKFTFPGGKPHINRVHGM